MSQKLKLSLVSVFCAAVLANCGGIGSVGPGSSGNSAGSVGGNSSAGSLGGSRTSEAPRQVTTQSPTNDGSVDPTLDPNRETIFDLFNAPDRNTDYRVNKYLWNAALDVLGFLPVESADPFSGIINMGYGRPAGGSQAYRATVRVSEAALDARALKVDIQTRSGPASAEVQRQIEDAILTRAKQLRIRDARL